MREHNQLLDVGYLNKIAAIMRREVKGRLLLDEPLSGHTSFRAGGPASLFAYPASVSDLRDLLHICSGNDIETFIIGYGTNLLVSDNGFPGCVIDLAEACRSFEIEDVILKAGAGVWGSDFVKGSAEAGLTGLEKLGGIPGGLGGWLSINGGAFRSSISDHVIKVSVMAEDGSVRNMSKDEIGFEYRSAPGLQNKIVLEAEFELDRGNRESAMKAVEETIMERYRRNVMTLPSAGSVFKNPPGEFAAKLTESIGAKGMSIGGVEVSSRHANFIVNSRGGSASDIVRLIRRLRRLVFDKYNIELELELRTLGFVPGEI